MPLMTNKTKALPKTMILVSMPRKRVSMWKSTVYIGVIRAHLSIILDSRRLRQEGVLSGVPPDPTSTESGVRRVAFALYT